MPVPEDLVKNVAELPTEDGAAGQGQTNGVGPKSKGPFLVMSSQDNSLVKVKANVK